MDSNKEKVLWASTHKLLPEQIEELKDYEVVKLEDVNVELYNKISNSPDDKIYLKMLARELVWYSLYLGVKYLLQPAGSPAFIACVAEVLSNSHLRLGFSHSARVSSEVIDIDGSVKKTSVFKHSHFIFL